MGKHVSLELSWVHYPEQTCDEAGLPSAKHRPALISLADVTSQEELGSDYGPAKGTGAFVRNSQSAV